MRSPPSAMMFSSNSTSSLTPVSWSMISAVDWINDGLCSICLAARIAPSVGLCFRAGVMGNNAVPIWSGKQGGAKRGAVPCGQHYGSFIPQRDCRVDPGGSPGGEVTGAQADEQE